MNFCAFWKSIIELYWTLGVMVCRERVSVELRRWASVYARKDKKIKNDIGTAASYRSI